MKRQYTLFVATPELLTCPEIFAHARNHHIILHPSEQRTLNIVSPLERPLTSVTKAQVAYDPSMIQLDTVHLACEGNLLYITLSLLALDVGETTIAITSPDTSEGSLPSPVCSVLLTN